ncbi:citrate synthase [Kytococcus aerolatus]|uniref:Citrate synthase n=1 Tax=Kytococcus aerolatus TaxID=592308 RepID=A0A212T8F3_9MICO|nr:citrate synthase [Kytococcus aerolatus]SNC62074.1 citrate synthase [Kytococcus aerolatus]
MTADQAPATFTHGEHTVEFPFVPSVEGDNGYDISALRKETGNVTLDPGFVNTASCSSAITFINGDEGILRYRGYPIEQLAEKSNFMEVAKLLMDGELPSAEELETFRQDVRAHAEMPEGMKGFFKSFPADAHPMPVLSSAISALCTYDTENLDPFDAEQLENASRRLMGQVPVLAANAYRNRQGLAPMQADTSLTVVENFLRMTFADADGSYELDERMARALDMLFILHADHEQNCSTSTVRLVGSANTNLYGSVSAGVQALWGPLHGGANQAVLEMLQGIQENGGDVDEFVRKVKNKEDGVKLMGFGHRVYKNYDPRAAIVKTTADEILEHLGAGDEQLEIAKKLEQVALTDEYFVERKLYPNVDFYTGLIYQAMGFPTDMFTVLFAIGRLPGWIAQYREMINDSTTKIGRPRQVYTGAAQRDYPTA